MFQISFACSSSVRCARTSKTPGVNARNAARENTFWDDPVGSMLSYLYEPRPGVKKIVAIAHNVAIAPLTYILS